MAEGLIHTRGAMLMTARILEMRVGFVFLPYTFLAIPWAHALSSSILTHPPEWGRRSILFLKT